MSDVTEALDTLVEAIKPLEAEVVQLLARKAELQEALDVINSRLATGRAMIRFINARPRDPQTPTARTE